MTEETYRDRSRAGPSAQITQLLVGQARMEQKMDNYLAQSAQVDDHEGRLIKLESFNGFVLWLVGAAFAVIVAAVGAGTWWLGNG